LILSDSQYIILENSHENQSLV